MIKFSLLSLPRIFFIIKYAKLIKVVYSGDAFPLASLMKSKIIHFASLLLPVAFVAVSLIFISHNSPKWIIQQNENQLRLIETQKAESCIRWLEPKCYKIDNKLLSIDVHNRLQTAILNKKEEAKSKKSEPVNLTKKTEQTAPPKPSENWYNGIEGDMGGIYRQVVADSINQYKITLDSGNSIDICVHAGMVAASYLQAQDSINYAKWKQRERVDCDGAGVPY